MFCSLLEELACVNVQRTHKVHAFLLIERNQESFVVGDICNLGPWETQKDDKFGASLCY